MVNAARTCCLATFLATPAFVVSQRPYEIRRWTNANGLPQITVNAIVQDARGYLWIGTFGGLVRFDGLRFLVFDPTSADLPMPNRVRSLLSEPSGDLWIGSEDAGLLHVHGDAVDRPLPGHEITSIHRLPDGRIVVAGLDEVWWSSTDRTSFVRDASPPPAAVRHLCGTDRSGLVALTDVGLFRHRGGAWSAVPMVDGNPACGIDADVDSAGNVWLRTGPGVARLAPEATMFSPLEPLSGPGSMLVVAADGTLWTDSLGRPMRRDPRFDRWLTVADVEVAASRASLVDRDGNLWLGGEDGLAFVTPAQLEVTEQEAHGVTGIGPILPAAGGGVWVGCADAILRLAPDHTVLERVASPDYVRALAPDPAGGLWACCGMTLTHIDGSRRRSIAMPAVGEQIIHILRALWVDADGAVWAGGTSGLLRVRGEAIDTWSTRDGMVGDDVLCIRRDAAGDLVVGTTRGACRLRAGRFETLLTPHGELPLQVRCIAPVSDGSIWFGTYGSGLCHWRQDSEEWFTVRDGLPDNCVSAVLLTPDDGIAVATNRGFARVGLDELAGTRSGSAAPLWTTFNSSAHRQVIEAQGGHQPSACVAEDGSIWFAVVRGIAHCRLELPVGPTPVDVHIEEVRSNAGTTRERRITLPEGVRDFSVAYSAPAYTAPRSVNFQYRLAPLDDHWLDAGTERVVTFRQLPAGRYEFGVRARTPGADPGDRSDSVVIEVPPHLYEMASVRLAIFVALLSLAALTLRFRARALQRRACELAELVHLRTADLRAEVDVRTKMEEELRRHRDELDARVGERTAELRRAYTDLEQELAARKQLQRELQVSQKMESLGQLAGAVAHDFNNLLTVINGTADLCAEDPSRDRGAALATILQAGRTASQLTRQLLIFARRQHLEPVAQTVEKCIESAQLLMRKSVGVRIALSFHLAPKPWPVFLPGGHVEQLLLNTCINASEAMPAGGNVAISTRNVTLLSKDVPAEVGPGDFVELVVRDDGPGMGPATLERALDPFFTTKTHGTGLGLSTCYGIARQAGGTLLIQSELGRGTSIRVLLPRHREALTAKSGHPLPKPKQRDLRILLVEDRDDVRETLRHQLVAAGHRVTDAGSGAEAVELMARADSSIDVVLVDVMMPGMSGPEAAARILETCPHLGIVFMSGSAPPDERRRLEASGACVLTKPFEASELEERLRAAAGTGPRNPGRSSTSVGTE